jgi:hypothetical protein
MAMVKTLIGVAGHFTISQHVEAKAVKLLSMVKP